MSRIVEKGIRLALAMPLPATETHDQGASHADTRTMESVAQVLREMGPGWHWEGEIAEREGSTQHVVRKALLALARQGKAHEWGKVSPIGSDIARSCAVLKANTDDTWFGGSTWGIEPASKLLPNLVRLFVDTQSTDTIERHCAVAKLLAKLFLGAPKSDATAARALLLELMPWVEGCFDFVAYGFETSEEIDARNKLEYERIRRENEQFEAAERKRWVAVQAHDQHLGPGQGHR